MLGHKTCTKCNTERGIDNFAFNKKFPDGLSYWCRTCNAETAKNWRINNPEKRKRGAKRKQLQKHYNLTIDKFEQMLKNQHYKCAVCLKEETAKSADGVIKQLSVDHCHKTNKIRGLLCDACNRAEGFLRSDVDLIRRLADYVEKHNLVQ